MYKALLIDPRRVPLTGSREKKDEQCGLNLSSRFGRLKGKLAIKFLKQNFGKTRVLVLFYKGCTT
jgi:hypothetical protein